MVTWFQVQDEELTQGIDVAYLLRKHLKVVERKMAGNDTIKNRAEVILVLGGARSGKSRYAQKIGKAVKGKKVFLATAQALDEEMARRIEKHKKQRGDEWETHEEPIELARVISELQHEYKVILVDCLTLWLSNLLMTYGDDCQRVEDRIQGLIECLTSMKNTVIFVSNEVGLGIVPENRMARSFRDLAGMLNQQVAEKADQVILMVAGMPLVVKGKA